MFLCSFSGALATLPAKYRRDQTAILQVLRKHPRFSVFDATEHKALATTLDRMKDRGLISYPDPQPEYPWIRAHLSDKALALLDRISGEEG